MRIAMIAAEVAPYAKTGGLGDVLAALPKHVAMLGHEVCLFVPKYRHIDLREIGATTEIERLPVPMGESSEPGSVHSLQLEGVRIYFLGGERYVERGVIYGYADDGERFVFACRAALEALKLLDWKPDVIHCHDWHTGLIPNWLNTLYRDDPFFIKTATLLTIHNLAFQGVFGRDILKLAGFAGNELPFSSRHPRRSDTVNFMARGIAFADQINTVSREYAHEILTPDYGEGLNKLLNRRKDDLSGILNGIDTDIYNPAIDPEIATNFDVSSCDLKLDNKLALQREAGLEQRPDRPLAAVVARLTRQKGVDLVAQTLPVLTRLGGQLVVLGVGDSDIEDQLVLAANAHHQAARAFLRFEPKLAQRAYAGADVLLAPSRFEPCGLTQMIAMRYGTVPVVRSTGGLAETVTDVSSDPDCGTGFTFDEFDPLDFIAAVARAFELYRSRADWRTLMLRCMAQDFSWGPAANEYSNLYVKLIEETRSGS
ncbi:MAG: glycogen synthase [Chloroflexi bacterium]|nr:glycogen synthase [Chloroflexota bacterium]MCY3938479.1 glycogen synthase [Chloroflexota bacterium]